MGLISLLSFDLGMPHPLSKEDSVVFVISQERKLRPKSQKQEVVRPGFEPQVGKVFYKQAGWSSLGSSAILILIQPSCMR